MATVYVGKSHFNKASVYGLKMPNKECSLIFEHVTLQ